VRQKILLALTKAYFGERRRVLRNIRLEGFEIIAPVNEVLGRQFIALHEYEKEETEFFRKHIKSDDVCFDVGGNVGYFSLLLSSLLDTGSVHSFEPITGNSTLIAASAALNGFDNITVNNTAVGDQNGHVNFSISEDSAYSSMIDTGRVSEKVNVSVPILRLDDYIKTAKTPKVDILKIDVEGAEAQVLDGAKALLQNSAKRPRIIMVELFDGNLLGFGSSKEEIISTLSEWGYTAHIVVDRSGQHAVYSAEKHPKMYNFIFMPSNISDHGGEYQDGA
jgi:FkbM family methyltransferase